MKTTRKPAVSDVTQNAERLLSDAELLIQNERFASAFMLAVLAFEEVGKALLWVWEQDERPPKARSRTSFHIRKQTAAGCLLMAGFAKEAITKRMVRMMAVVQKQVQKQERTLDDAAKDATKGWIEDLAKALFESSEGRLARLIEIGAVDTTKQAATYIDEWFAEHDLLPSGFDAADAQRFVTDARAALALMADKMAMKVGLAIFQVREGRSDKAGAVPPSNGART